MQLVDMGVFSSKPATVAPVNWGMSSPINASLNSKCPQLEEDERELLKKRRHSINECIKGKYGSIYNASSSNDKKKLREGCINEERTPGQQGGRRKKRATRKQRR